jgi:hypothetical protein
MEIKKVKMASDMHLTSTSYLINGQSHNVLIKEVQMSSPGMSLISKHLRGYVIP